VHVPRIMWKFFEDELTGSFAEVDVESFGIGDDGLIYYAVQTDFDDSYDAVDCQRRIHYHIKTPS